MTFEEFVDLRLPALSRFAVNDASGTVSYRSGFWNSVTLSPACRRMEASVPRFIVACCGTTTTLPSGWRNTSWIPLLRT